MISTISSIPKFFESIHYEEYPEDDFQYDLTELLWRAEEFPKKCRHCSQYPVFDPMVVNKICYWILECTYGWDHILSTQPYKNPIKTVLAWNNLMDTAGGGYAK